MNDSSSPQKKSVSQKKKEKKKDSAISFETFFLKSLSIISDK